MAAESLLLVDIRQEQGSVTLALSDGRSYEIAADSVPADLVEVGQEVSPPLLAEIEFAAERKQVARRVFLSLDRRLQPVARLRAKLLEREFSARAVDAVLAQMAERGLYSDRHFAEAWIRDTLATKAVGRSYLESRLRRKSVPGPVAVAAAEACLERDREKELARTAARAKWRRMPPGRDRRAEAKVIRHLQSRGFPISTAVAAARETGEAADDPPYEAD